MTPEEFTAKLTMVSHLKRRLEPLEAQIKPLKDELEQLKLEVYAHMTQTKSKRTEPVDGYFIVRKVGRAKVEVDTEAAENWLTANLPTVDHYELYLEPALDPAKLVKLRDQHLLATGEVLDFIRQTTGPDILAISREKTS